MLAISVYNEMIAVNCKRDTIQHNTYELYTFSNSTELYIYEVSLRPEISCKSRLNE